MTLRRTRILAASLVAIATFSLYSTTLGHRFVNWDDDAYVYANPAVQSLTPGAVARLFSSFYYYAYIPVTMLSHAADVAVWGMKPRGHHLTNVLLHTANAVWLFLLGIGLIAARRGTRARAAAPHEVAAVIGMSLAAALFSFHPLRAESVSWVSDRKDLLCAFFFLPGVLAYLKYASRRGASGALPWYVASFVLFLLACLSKLIAAMFPAVLLLLDWLWPPQPRRGSGTARLLLDKAPFVAVSLILIVLSSAVSPDAKRAYAVAHLTGIEAYLFPFYSLGFSIGKTLLPVGLKPIYPRVGIEWMIAGLFFVLAVTGACALLARRRTKGPLLAWMVTLALLLPNVAGLSSGMQSVADRYSYLATIGLYLLLGGGIAALWEKGGAARRLAVMAGSCALAAILAASTLKQTDHWKTSVSLWEYVVQSSPAKRDYADAYLNLGAAYSEERRPAEARRVLERAAAIDSTNAEVFYNLGVLTYQDGDREKAAERFRSATLADPRHARALYNYAIVLDQLGRHEEAIPPMVRAARIGSKDAREALTSMGLAW